MRPVLEADNLTAFFEPIVLLCGILSISQHYGSPRCVAGIALLFICRLCSYLTWNTFISPHGLLRRELYCTWSLSHYAPYRLDTENVVKYICGVGAGVNQEAQFTRLVWDEKAAGGSRADVCRRWRLPRQILFLAVGARLGTILCPISEAPMVPAGACCIVEAGGLIVEAAISWGGRTISLVVATVPGARAAVPGAGATVVPLSAKSLHLARDFLDALQERGVVGRSANIRELRRGDGVHDGACTAGRGV
jgi:hypothetical protein